MQICLHLCSSLRMFCFWRRGEKYLEKSCKPVVFTYHVRLCTCSARIFAASFANLFPSSSHLLLEFFFLEILANLLFPSFVRSHVMLRSLQHPLQICFHPLHLSSLGFWKDPCQCVSISTWVCLNLWWKLTKLLPGFSEKKIANLFQSFVSSHVFFCLDL